MNSGIFCPNSACPASGRAEPGQIWIHDRRRGRYRCTVCRRTFTARTGTLLAQKQTAANTIALVLALLAYGCPIAAIEFAFGLDRRTVRRWVREAGQHAQRVHQHLVLQPRDLQHVQADELRLKAQGGVVWMAMALVVPTLLWLGGVVQGERNRALITALMQQVRTGAQLGKRLLISTDGLHHYRTATAWVFRQAQRTGRRGRPRLRAWPGVVLVQVVKMTRRGVWAPWSRTRVQHGARIAWMLGRLPRCTVVSTAAIERLNATFRERCAALARRTRHLARQVGTLEQSMYLLGTVYNFCTVHQTLQQTPAMAAGLTDHCWTVGELVGYRLPPSPPAQAKGS